jgi:putative selenate reductase
VVIATGAWKEGEPVVKQGQENILNALKFLEDVKESNYGLNIGKKIAVIGTGGMAIDCAVAAKRCKGVDSVTVIYGHSGEFFPTTTEKITIRELSSPENWNNGILTCEEMTGDNDFSGKRVFKPTGKKQDLRFDTVISAADPKVDDSFFTANSIHFADNLPKTGANLESSLSDVYIAGSCRTGVLSTIFAAEDGKAAAEDILRKLNINADFSEEEKNEKELTANLYQKKGVILEARNDNTDAERCLSCNALCEICVDVCPNRANVSVALKADKTQIRQIVHIDSMCNDCGNCAVFCPYTGRPYKDKPVIFYNEEDFTDSESAGILKTGEDAYTVRLENKSIVKYRAGGKKLPRGWAALLDAITARYGYLFNA